MNIEINVRLYGEFKKHAPGDQNDFMLVLEPGATLGEVLGNLDDPHYCLARFTAFPHLSEGDKGPQLAAYLGIGGEH